MRILLTNDDGIYSPGLRALWEALGDEHEIWTVAPDRERSANSHCITIKDPVRFHEVGERRFACGGTPADCVLFSCLGAIPAKPDLVLSGINLGPNLGTDIIYSGTAAAARQAALMKIPAMALSQASFKPPFFFDRGAAWLKANIDALMQLWHPDHFININVPNSLDGVLEARITHPSRRFYEDHLTHFESPGGDKFYFLNGNMIEQDQEDGSDAEAVEAGFVSVSPVYLHPINHSEQAAYQREVFRKLS
jgi:5'-nucleotidase